MTTGLDRREGSGSVYYGYRLRNMLEKQRPSRRAPAMWDDEKAREVGLRWLIFFLGLWLGASWVYLWTR